MKKFFALLSIAALLSACGGSTDKQAELEKLRAEYNALGEKIHALEEQLASESGSSTDAKQVYVTQYATQPFERIVTVQGIVDGDQIINLSPTASGEVKELHAKVGQSVKKGDVLARIDAAVLEKSMRELRTALDLANTMYKKQAALWADSIGSEVQYIQAKNTKESLDNKIASLQEQMELYILRAPIDGTIEVVNLRLGQLASPQMPALTMANFGELKVTAEISESYTAMVSKGDKIDVTFPDIDKTVPLEVATVSNVINPRSRTFTIEAKVPKLPEVKANMLAKVGLVTYRNPNAVVLPINVIQSSTNGNFVWVYNPQTKTAEKREIKTGVQAENLIEILDGLSSLDYVITTGYQGLNQGQAVQIAQ